MSQDNQYNNALQGSKTNMVMTVHTGDIRSFMTLCKNKFQIAIPPVAFPAPPVDPNLHYAAHMVGKSSNISYT